MSLSLNVSSFLKYSTKLLVACTMFDKSYVRGSHPPHVIADSESVSIDNILAGIA
jgi:hypothetical protein